MVAMVIMVTMTNMVAMVVMGRTGQERTGKTKLPFKLDFPGNLCGAAFAILAMFS